MIRHLSFDWSFYRSRSQVLAVWHSYNHLRDQPTSLRLYRFEHPLTFIFILKFKSNSYLHQSISLESSHSPSVYVKIIIALRVVKNNNLNCGQARADSDAFGISDALRQSLPYHIQYTTTRYQLARYCPSGLRQSLICSADTSLIIVWQWSDAYNQVNVMELFAPSFVV